jgi:hypothetical protein
MQYLHLQKVYLKFRLGASFAVLRPEMSNRADVALRNLQTLAEQPAEF